jgi:hypothetical protein
VNEGGRLEGVALTFASQRATCLPAKLVIDDPREHVARLRVTRAPRVEELGNAVRAAGRERTSAVRRRWDSHGCAHWIEGRTPWLLIGHSRS